MTRILNNRSRNIFLSICVILFLFTGCSSTKYSTAEKYVKNKQYEAAVREYLKLLSPHKRGNKRYIHYDKEAMAGIGIVYMNMLKYENAIKIFERVLIKDPGYGKALFHLGLTYEGMGKSDKALDVYKKYFETKPLDPYRHAMIARKDFILSSWAEEEIETKIAAQSQVNLNLIDTKQIAVVYFLNLSNNPDWLPFQTGLCDLLISDLSKVDKFNVVSREKIDAVLNQLRIIPEEIMNDEIADQVARVLGVRVLVRGSYMIMDNMNMTLDVEYYDAGRKHLSKQENFEADIYNLFQIEKEIVLKLIDYNAIQMDAITRDNILEIPTNNMEAFFQYSNGIYSMDVGDIETAQVHFSKALNLDNNFILAYDRLIYPEVWDATHHENINRVQQEINTWARSLPRGRLVAYKPPRPLASTWNRLQWMTTQQENLFIPSEDSRKAIQEADYIGIRVTPRLLVTPPSPLTSASD